MLGYILWLLVGAAIGVYAAPTISEPRRGCCAACAT
jgi:hypothetical protein